MIQKIITRKEAIKKGLKRFYNGNPCKYGHYSERNISNSGCIKCREIKRLDPEFKKKCKEYGKKHRNKNITRLSAISKKYRDNNKPKISESRKRHYKKNKKKILEKAKIYKSSPANYETFCPQIIGYECRKTKTGKLSLKCKQCSNWFLPKTSAVMSRISSTNGKGRTLGSENHLYCSEECKNNCDLFYAVSILKSDRSKIKRQRCHQKTNKKALVDNQKDMYGYSFCEKCGNKTNELDIHHGLLVSENHKEADNISHQILLCKDCHKKPETHCKN